MYDGFGDAVFGEVLFQLVRVSDIAKLRLLCLALAQGAAESVAERGLLGALTGGLSSASAGIAASLTVGFVMALAGRSRDQN